ncbi:hypothetical protein CLOP_g20402, partial [Closterium sp. NIES-67]
LKSRRSEYCSRTVVLITASGLQGEQPLVNGLMWGKGSRQNGSVTSGKGLAPRAGPGGLRLDAAGCRRSTRRRFTPVRAGPACLLADGRRAVPSRGPSPGRRAVVSELARTRGIRLFN